MVLTFLIASTASEYIYPKTLDQPWDHSPITVYIDNKNLPPHYNPSYYTQIEKALNYWEEGGNGKLNYTPVFKIVDSENADIRITWVENLEKNASAPSGVAGYTTPQIENSRFLHVDMILGIGDYKGTEWIQYEDETMLILAKHELGHALGLDHSSDKQDIMYPDYKQKNDLNSLLTDKYDFLLIAGYGVLAVIVFLAVSRLLDRRKR
ncbi:MAG: peptidase [Alphaproteobacteria bacterium]|nr:MAG: peptidase [Alphaproteobacteria bacterium]